MVTVFPAAPEKIVFEQFLPENACDVEGGVGAPLHRTTRRSVIRCVSGAIPHAETRAGKAAAPLIAPAPSIGQAGLAARPVLA